ncbi:hypothetical protein RCC89_13975 [Cytophagaceae bacterium ABcell3]|nr:hypothetical protein RCC89_13975 [Cytophagaceae bacterium ABcell3]
MTDKNKQKVLIIWLVLLLIPFILLTDLFPLMRFGMFAEPVVHTSQKEKLEIFISENNGRKVFDSMNINLSPSAFFYLCRNYYYRDESALLLERVANLYNKNNSTFYLYKITLADNPAQNDTLVVASYKK